MEIEALLFFLHQNFVLLHFGHFHNFISSVLKCKLFFSAELAPRMWPQLI